MLSLPFIASSCIVTEENLLFETVQSGLRSFFCMFSLLLKDIIFVFFIILGTKIIIWKAEGVL